MEKTTKEIFNTDVVYDHGGLSVEWSSPRGVATTAILSDGKRYNREKGVRDLRLFFRLDAVQREVRVDSQLMYDLITEMENFVASVGNNKTLISEDTLVCGFTNLRMYKFCRRFGFRVSEKDAQRAESGDPMQRIMMMASIGEIKKALMNESVQEDKKKLQKRLMI